MPDKIILSNWGERPGLEKAIEVCSELEVKFISNNNKFSHRALTSAYGETWDDGCCNYDEYKYVLNELHEIYECLSRSSRLEPLKRMSIQDYQDRVRSQYILIKRLFKSFKPDLIFFGNLPHEGYDIIMANICRYIGLPYYSAYQLDFVSRFVILRGPQNNYRWDFRNQIQSIKQVLSFEEEKSISNYIESLKGKQNYFYMKNINVKGLPNWKNLFLPANSIKQYLYRLYFIPFCKIKHSLYKKRLSMISTDQKNLPLEKPFIYLALHLQPELSTSALGGIYNDQTILISEISSIASKYNISVIIKENPKQSFTHRSNSFFKVLNNLNNVYLAPIEMSSHFLMKKSLLVATVSGTVGPEAINQGKYAYCAGRTWYSHHPKVIRSMKELQIFLKSYPERKKENSNLDWRMFLKGVAEYSWNGLSDSDYCDHFKIPDNENIKILSESILLFSKLVKSN